MNQIQLDYKTMLKDHKIEIARLEAILVEKEEEIAEISKANKILLSRVCAAVADIEAIRKDWAGIKNTGLHQTQENDPFTICPN